MNDLSDSELVARAQQGDSKALGILVARHRPNVQRQLRRFGLPEADRHDLEQETFLQVVRRLDSFRGDARFSTWLFQVTANAARMRLRSDRRRRQSALEDHMDDAERALASAPDGGPSTRAWRVRVDEQLDAERTARTVRKVIEEFNDEARELLSSHYLDGETLQTIADRKGTTETAIRSRLHRVRSAVRDRIAEVSPELVPMARA